jgi:hypothetical protein
MFVLDVIGGFGHTVFFKQLFIGLSTVCSAFQPLFNSPKLVYRLFVFFEFLY